MKTIIHLFLFIFLFSSCQQSNNKSSETNVDDIQIDTSLKSTSENTDIQTKEKNTENEKLADKSVLDFDQLYPILKKGLLKQVCESYNAKDEKNRLKATSKETGNRFLSIWEWDFETSPLLVKDIDNDGLVDYTIELYNQGGGCGGNIGQQERWTLFGAKPDKFIWTHTIPYRSESGKWEKM